MALEKDIVTEDGITLSYHRIVRLSCDVNVMNSLTVQSYISEEQRNIEKIAERDGKKAIVFVRVSVYACDYDENMSVKRGYKYLKTLKIFEDAKDV